MINQRFDTPQKACSGHTSRSFLSSVCRAEMHNAEIPLKVITAWEVLGEMPGIGVTQLVREIKKRGVHTSPDVINAMDKYGFLISEDDHARLFQDRRVNVHK